MPRADLDDQTAADLLALLESCRDRDGLLSTPPQAGSAPHLSWPHQGQYYVSTGTGGAFIHPDPAAFLTGRLDAFIKDRLLSLTAGDLDAASLQPQLDRIARLKAAAVPVIDALTRAEEERKRHWLAQTLVLETNYCVTLDRVPRALYPEIAANDAQRAEWVRLYRIDALPESLMEPGYSEPLSVTFLEANPFLMLDTCFFDASFTDRLLASFDDLDAALDGLLIHADNFHALSLLQPRYRDAIDCIYTDPPYNTGGADLSYPDRYAPAHWLTLMDNRLRLAHQLLKPGGSCFISIDENQQARLELLLAGIFAPEDFVATFVWEAGRKNDSKLVSVSHEYMLAYVKGLAGPARKALTWRVRKEGIDEIHAKARLLVRKCDGDYARASLKLRQWLNGLPDNHPARRHKHYHCVDARGVYHPGNISWPGGGGPSYEVLHPVTGRPCKIPSRGWMYPTPQRMAEAIRDDLVHFGPDETRVPCAKVYLHANEHQAPNSVFYRDGRAAMKRLRHILGDDCFCNPKDELLIADRIRFSSPPDATVLDFFAGSGSTAHAVIHLNRSPDPSPPLKARPETSVAPTEAPNVAPSVAPDATPSVASSVAPASRRWYSGALGCTLHPTSATADAPVASRRRYILVEMGPAFDTILRPRIQKVAYASKWKQGAPQTRDAQSHMFKYLRLGSASADQLLPPPSGGGRPTPTPPSLSFQPAPAGLAGDRESRPKPTPTRPDMVESLTHLLGLRVRRMRTEDPRGIRTIEALSPANERVLIIWRNLSGDSHADERNLQEWFEARRKPGLECDIIYVNGDQRLEALRRPGETWQLRQIEAHFEPLRCTGVP